MREISEEEFLPANFLDSKLAQLEDVLSDKLESAFHKPNSNPFYYDVAKIIAEYSAIDLAYAVSRLPAHERPVVYENLSTYFDKMEFLIHANKRTREAIFQHISDEETKNLVEHMPPDDAFEVLEDLSERRFRRVLELLEPSKAARIREIKTHRRNTAGRLMTNEFFAFSMDMTIGEAAIAIRNNPGIGFTDWIFVLNSHGELQGYVPARYLIINASSIPLRQIMRSIAHKVHPDVSREEVVEIVERYKISALPVVNAEDCPIGVITQEDVIETVEDIADETIANMAGTAEKVSEQESLCKRFLYRAPWLLVTLCAGLLNVGIMTWFQHYEEGILTFALFFVPLITGMSGNIGIQCSTVLVRGMATGLFSKKNRREAIWKESCIGLCAGGFFGVLCGLLVYFLDFMGVRDSLLHPAILGLIVGAGLMGACFAGTFLGVFSPIFFVRIGIDPAVASGPIVTAFNDFLSMSIYFLVAMWLRFCFF